MRRVLPIHVEAEVRDWRLGQAARPQVGEKVGSVGAKASDRSDAFATEPFQGALRVAVVGNGFLEEGSAPWIVALPVGRRLDLDGQDGAEAGVDPFQCEQRPEQQRGACQHYDAERDLPRNQQASDQRRPPGGTARAGLAQGRVEIQSPRADERGGPEAERRRDAHDRGEREGPPVDPERHPERQTRRDQRRHLRDDVTSDQEAGSDREGGEHQALHEHLPGQLRTTRAERGAHRHLPLTRDSLGEQDTGDVGARHEEHQGTDAERQQQRRPFIVDVELPKGDHPGAETRVVAGVDALELGCDRRQLSPRGGERRPRTQSGDRAIRAVLARGAALVDAQRDPHLCELRELEAGRHHARDGVDDAIELDLLAQGGGTASEAPLPQAVADHDDFGRARLLVARREAAAERGSDPEQLEQRCTSPKSRHPGRVGISRDHELGILERDHLGMTAGPSPPVGDGWIAHREALEALARDRVVHPDDPTGICVGERPQHRRVHDAEQGGICADRQGPRSALRPRCRRGSCRERANPGERLRSSSWLPRFLDGCSDPTQVERRDDLCELGRRDALLLG